MPIIWIHGDCLTPTNPALLAYPDAPAIFVWDDKVLAHYAISFKRVLFMYECLLELPVTIMKGDTIETLTRFAQTHGTAEIATTATPAPRFTTLCNQLRQNDFSFSIETHIVPPFLDYDGDLDLKRFSRYWRTAQKHLRS